MMEETRYQEDQIKNLLFKMSSTFLEISFREQYNLDKDSDIEFELETDEFRTLFKHLAKRVYLLCLAYLETRKLTSYLAKFKTDIHPYFEESNDIMKGTFNDESGDYFSDLVSLYWDYLSVFPAFDMNTEDENYKRRIGLLYLEDILVSTAVIIRDLEKEVRNESDIYKAVKVVTKATFPTLISPSGTFQKTAKCYNPDILIPALNCAVEYKYATTEIKLITTIDEILIDAKGYEKHDTYKFFYAVFYVTAGIWTRKRFEEVWEEKKFPENWKGIFVESDGRE